jgi:hypothetical protein
MPNAEQKTFPFRQDSRAQPAKRKAKRTLETSDSENPRTQTIYSSISLRRYQREATQTLLEFTTKKQYPHQES